jgi:competence protein ComEA
LRERSQGAAVGLGLAVLLYLAALVPAPPSAPPCPAPGEVAAHGAHASAVGCHAPAPAAPLRGPARLLFGERLDVNRADAASLEVLPGIGPARAAAIVRERCRGAYGSVAELTRVPGIGVKTVARLAPWLDVGAAAPARCTVVH